MTIEGEQDWRKQRKEEAWRESVNGYRRKEERKEKNRQDPRGSERNLRVENIRREITKARL